MRSKQAQFYIIGAVILGIIILSVATLWNAPLKDKSQGAKTNFQVLCQNYKNEVFEISKYALAQGGNEKELIKDFTIDFINYARGSAPSFGLLYVYGNKGSAVIFNATNSEVTIKDGGVSWEHGNGYSYGTTSEDSLNITIENNKINKLYNLEEQDSFYVIAVETKEGEQYVCE